MTLPLLSFSAGLNPPPPLSDTGVSETGSTAFFFKDTEAETKIP